MVAIRCEASGCRTSGPGKIFFQCGRCRRWWCAQHAREGLRCPGCEQGFVNR